METVNILAKIREGMSVYDPNGDGIGSVNYVQITDELPAQPGPETAGTTAPQPLYNDTFIQDIADVLDGDSELPVELRKRLRREGFIRIDIGFLKSDRFALPHQIDSVSDEEVHLKVGADELVIAE